MAHFAQPLLVSQLFTAEAAPAAMGRPCARQSAQASRFASPPPSPWPEALLTLFGLRMASHGMSISRIGMQLDTGYALQQLAHAREMGDATLALMVDELFRCFQTHQSGFPCRSTEHVAAPRASSLATENR